MTSGGFGSGFWFINVGTRAAECRLILIAVRQTKFTQNYSVFNQGGKKKAPTKLLLNLQ